MHGRPISESIALAEAHAKELGYELAMDPDFAAALEEIIKSRKPPQHPRQDPKVEFHSAKEGRRPRD